MDRGGSSPPLLLGGSGGAERDQRGRGGSAPRPDLTPAPGTDGPSSRRAAGAFPTTEGTRRGGGNNPVSQPEGCRVTLGNAAVRREAPGGVSLVVPQPNINATVAQNILLSVEYSCRGVATIEWKHVSSWGTTSIAEWRSGNYVNISTVYKDRVTTFENGSIQLRNVGMRDAGYYFVTVMEEHGTNAYGTIIVNVYEIIYEDLHFVAVLFAFLAAVSAILICFMWLCNKSLHLFQKKTTHKLTASTTEEIELETIEC
ncbi:V-set and transmembrane domain-containing protein 5 isoform X1 [Vidua chalybeata]|uniref:V-set and transmembrane domain-containing protein 5 isoform X1 n=1 Tax=Vidua chalybeata TaxID=81927 RepID=UPI0023A8D963|nr:V-set and transmembrane domain-containing protein 5 isoform X1 [Vidua chalybeata]